MRYITVKEASEKWGITTRQICKLCSNGRIPGAEKRSKVWMIPYNAKKPCDGRKSESENDFEPALLLFNPDYLDNNNITDNKEASILCEAQRLYLEGKVQEGYELINSLSVKDKSYTFVANMIKMIILNRLGRKEEVELLCDWLYKETNEGKKRIEHLIFLSFWEYEIDFDDFPKGEEIQLEIMPLFAFIEARKELNKIIRSSARQNIFNLEIICDSLIDKNCPLILAYYHIFLAVYYNALAEKSAYMHHIMKAVNILLPRKWYMPLAEYSSTIDLSFIKNIDEKAYLEVMNQSKIAIISYIKMGILDDICISPKLSPAINIQIAFLLMHGKNNREIAEELGITQYKVKQHIDDIAMAIGATSKKEIKDFFVRNFVI